MEVMMPETLLTPTGIKLYGRVVIGLKLDNPPVPATVVPTGTNTFLYNQLKTDAAGNPPTLARIYGFSYEGHYYDLAKPAIFVVHGSGTPVDVGKNKDRTSVDTSGVITKEWEFSNQPPGAAAADLMMWEYDKGDFSLRLDIESGPFEQILLAAALRGGSSAYSSGADLRTSGADLRSSGADLRISGADLRRR
jgi:hypothetical protein